MNHFLLSVKWIQVLLLFYSTLFIHLPTVICYVFRITKFSYTIKEFHVLQFNTNYSIQNYSFVCTQLNSPKYCYCCILTTIMISITTVPQTQYSNTGAMQRQADSVVQVRTVLLTSYFGSSTRGERTQFLLCWPYYLTLPTLCASCDV